jgi:hypothetical protein
MAFQVAYNWLYFSMFYIIKTYEIPATEWNPFHKYAPSIDKPRGLYFAPFSLNWLHDIPGLWTMFYPLADRSTFTEAQLSLIDRQNMLLNATLRQGH